MKYNGLHLGFCLALATYFSNHSHWGSQLHVKRTPKGAYGEEIASEELTSKHISLEADVPPSQISDETQLRA